METFRTTPVVLAAFSTPPKPTGANGRTGCTDSSMGNAMKAARKEIPAAIIRETGGYKRDRILTRP
jgi:hypothetical protein